MLALVHLSPQARSDPAFAGMLTPMAVVAETAPVTTDAGGAGQLLPPTNGAARRRPRSAGGPAGPLIEQVPDEGASPTTAGTSAYGGPGSRPSAVALPRFRCGWWRAST